jgi:hypothetical protein
MQFHSGISKSATDLLRGTVCVRKWAARSLMSKERTQRFPPIVPRDIHFVKAVVRLVLEEPLYAAIESTVGLLPRVVPRVERSPVLESESKALKLLRL